MNKILVDENLSYKILNSLNNFPGSLHVNDVRLNESLDDKIWHYAKAGDFCILTRDIDFYNMSILLGCPPKVIHLKTPSVGQSTQYFKNKLTQNTDHILDFLAASDVCYLIIE